MGFCEKIECSRTKSLLVNGASKEGSIDLRISQLKSELQNNEDETELLKLNSRITNLSSLACYFYVGGNSELDRIAYRDWETDRKSTRLNSSHSRASRMPSSA